MSNQSTAEAMPEGEVSGHASFLHRGGSRLGRFGMALADGLMGLLGLCLRLGGRPLRNGLIRLFGAAAYHIMRDKRRIARINLDLVFGDSRSPAEKERIVRAMYDHFARAMLDFLFDYIFWPRRELESAMTADARARLDDLRAEGRGSAVVSCHLGNPELLLRLLTHSGYDGYAIYKGFSGAWFDRYVGRKRLRAGCGLIEVPGSRHRIRAGQRESVNEGSLRAEVEALWARNKGLGFVADQYARRGAIKTTVLGVPDTPTQVGAWRYVVENRIPFLLHVAIYRPDGGLDWHCSDVIRIADQGGADATLRHYLELANGWFEDAIRAHPEQYAWGHRRFDRSYYKQP